MTCGASAQTPPATPPQTPLKGCEPEYPSCPAVLENQVQLALAEKPNPKSPPNTPLEEITIKAINTPISSVWLKLVFYTVADAVAPDSTTSAIRALKPYLTQGETARTDKQTGAVSSSAGSTGLAEKAGLTTFLTYAIENGALQENVSGTTVTLTGSPYGLVNLAPGGDTPENYARYAAWRRINLSASFNIENPSQPLASVNAKQLSAYSARLRIWGDRSTRAKHFSQLYEQTFHAVTVRRLMPLAMGEQEILNSFTDDDSLRRGIKEEIISRIQADCSAADKLAANGTMTPIGKDCAAGILYKGLYEKIYLRVKDGTLKIPDDVKADINLKIVPALADAYAQQVAAQANWKTELEKLAHTPLLTFEYTNHRQANVSGYSEFKLLFEGNIAPVDLTANAGFSTYSSPNPSLNQSRFRDYFGNLSFEGSSKSPLRANPSDASKITYSISAQLERMKETRANVAVAQVKIEIPIAAALSLPISVSYANRTELIKEKEIKGHFGLTLDIDKLTSILHASK